MKRTIVTPSGQIEVPLTKEEIKEFEKEIATQEDLEIKNQLKEKMEKEVVLKVFDELLDLIGLQEKERIIFEEAFLEKYRD